MVSDSKNSAKLMFDDQEIDLPIFSPNLGPDVVYIRKLYAQGDVFTYDPGFTSTASCESAITFIDGDKGELRISSVVSVATHTRCRSFVVFRAQCRRSITIPQTLMTRGSAK
jgi:hypothetical protein